MYDLRLKNIPAEVWMGILVLACTILLFTSGVKNVLPASGSVEKKVILIDAGHGGDDPGKIGINQAKEKDINLAIAKKLKVCLEKAVLFPGQRPTTRSDMWTRFFILHRNEIFNKFQ